jgi:hypothetical protein
MCLSWCRSLVIEIQVEAGIVHRSWIDGDAKFRQEAEPPTACRGGAHGSRAILGGDGASGPIRKKLAASGNSPPGSDPPDGRGLPRGADGPPVPYRRSWLTWTRLRQASFGIAILVPPHARCLRFVRRCCGGTRRENVTDGTELEDQRVESFVDRRPPLSPGVSARQGRRWLRRDSIPPACCPRRSASFRR